MRLDKLLSNMGYGSRKEMKKWLKAGNVTVDGTPVKDGKHQIDPEKQTVAVGGEEVHYREFIYLMMNKPQNVISSTEDGLHETVINLIDPQYHIFDPFPVGRLDKDTEGFLLLTNDGGLAHELLSPKKHVAKTYFARIDGKVTEDDIKAFQHGVTLDDGYETKPGELVILNSGDISEVELTITEGKFHQVKRMFQAVGKEVVFLKRLSMGSLELDEALEPGEYRELTEKELSKLKERSL
ncbi:pseudouridine synthase [Jeotgalibacillus salarius]|uniref:Pseudouridine synthase n=1 Tax=Jeotgalibacillus salarius TaxID=546023 RepID=A0A4Y8LCL7_9BACL|nr:pseudouridine synthase [Jeotgalibacillus salarius]TFD98266.1 rRNA pseudouridine synthase [Jeotgalibacillus salarius]